MTARDAPRVAFSELIERGMISPAPKLFDSTQRHNALVRADGALSVGEKVGSIHRIGALVQGAEACNGWTFWHIETKKGLTPIDSLRAEIRAAWARSRNHVWSRHAARLVPGHPRLCFATDDKEDVDGRHRRAKPTPFSERLCPAITTYSSFETRAQALSG